MQSEISALLRGETEPARAGAEKGQAAKWMGDAAIIVAGAGCYGAAMGSWRDPRQALFTAIKLPLIILLTAGGNALLNSMLAPLLGLNIRFRQTLSVVLMSFTITALILGAFSPLLAFVVWNAPAMGADLDSPAYRFILLTHTAVIALAGVAGNLRLFQILAQLGKSERVARRVLLAWLACNLFLGSQLSWILRPFVGSPHLAVEFWRKTALEGNFYETIFHLTQHLFR